MNYIITHTDTFNLLLLALSVLHNNGVHISLEYFLSDFVNLLSSNIRSWSAASLNEELISTANIRNHEPVHAFFHSSRSATDDYSHHSSSSFVIFISVYLC